MNVIREHRRLVGVRKLRSRSRGLAKRIILRLCCVNATSGREGLVIVGPFPPPVHGAANVTAAIAERVRAERTPLIVVDTSGYSQGAGQTYHRHRVKSHGSVIHTLVTRCRSFRTVYIAGAGGAGIWYQVVVVVVARVFRYRIFFHHHSFVYVTKPALSMRALCLVGGSKTTHIALCQTMATQIRAKYSRTRTIRVLSNASLLAPRFRNDFPPRTNQDVFTLGHMSNLSVEKGLCVAIDSLREMRKSGYNARLLLAGPLAGETERKILDAAIQEHGTNCQWLGQVSHDKVPQFFQDIDLFLFPSTYRHEAEPLVVLEASREGVPTLAFDVGCVSALVAAPPSRVVQVGGDFPGYAVVVAADIARAGGRFSLDTKVLDTFTALREQSLKQQLRLVSALTTGGEL